MKIQMTKQISFFYFFLIFSLYGQSDSFNSRVKRHPKFTQEEKIRRTMETLCQCCKEQQKGAPDQNVIDCARELVNADKEYQSKSSWLNSVLFKYPRMQDVGIVGLSFLGGFATHWLLSDF